MSEKKVPDMPIPSKEIPRMELPELRKEVAVLRLYVASFKSLMQDFIDNAKLPEAVNHRIAELDEKIGLTADSITQFERILIEHRTLPHDQQDLQRSLQSLSRRIDALERKSK